MHVHLGVVTVDMGVRIHTMIVRVRVDSSGVGVCGCEAVGDPLCDASEKPSESVSKFVWKQIGETHEHFPSRGSARESMIDTAIEHEISSAV